MKFTFLLFLLFFSFQLVFTQNIQSYKEAYPSGELMISGFYKNDLRFGIWKTFYKSGKVSIINTYNEKGEISREFSTYYENGVVKSKKRLEDEESNKILETGYYENGQLKYENSEKAGVVKTYYKTGELKSVSEHSKNIIKGPWKSYYKDGNLEWVVNYKDGYRDGIYQNYYKNGDLKVEGLMVKDLKQGEEKRYLIKKKLEWIGFYNKDLLEDTWKKYDANGLVIEEIKFKKGKARKSKNRNSILPTIVADGIYDKTPIYPGCEKFLISEKRKKCMNDNFSNFFNKNFNLDIAKKTKLYGPQRFIIHFQIDNLGNANSAHGEWPNEDIGRDVVRVIKKLPKVKPAIRYGESISLLYSIPVFFQVF